MLILLGKPKVTFYCKSHLAVRRGRKLRKTPIYFVKRIFSLARVELSKLNSPGSTKDDLPYSTFSGAEMPNIDD